MYTDAQMYNHEHRKFWNVFMTLTILKMQHLISIPAGPHTLSWFLRQYWLFLWPMHCLYKCTEMGAMRMFVCHWLVFLTNIVKAQLGYDASISISFDFMGECIMIYSVLKSLCPVMDIYIAIFWISRKCF